MILARTLNLDNLTQDNINEIIQNTTHKDFKSIKRYYESGSLEIYENGEELLEVWENDLTCIDSIILSDGKAIAFIGG